MGSTKEQMEIEDEYHVVIQCPRCGIPTEAWPSDVPSADFGADTAHDGEDTRNFEMDCEKCGHSFSVTLRANWGGREVFLTEDPSQTGIITSTDYGSGLDEWSGEPPPEPGAYGIFLSALDELRTMVGEMGTPDGASSVNRMLFVHLYSVVEAYLSDVIGGIAMTDTKVQLKLLNHVEALRTKKVSLEEVLKQPTVVVDYIRSNLARTSFHNLEAVDKICGATIDHTIWPGANDDRFLLEASVGKRHDCVHRNGLTPGGDKHADILPDYILSLARLFEEMAQNLEDRLSDLKVERFFEDLGEGETLAKT